jgi:conjugal transfer mating pair stabilization protein TraG
MAVTVYTYFNIDQVASLMDGIAAITASATYLGMFRTIALLGFLVFVAGMATGKAQEPFEFFRWLIIMMLIHSVLLVPKTDVILIDKTGSTPPTVRSNIPIGFAFFASITSHGGDVLTQMFETVFALPDDLRFQKHGIMFGNTVLTDSLLTNPVTPAFRSDLTNFINNCTYYDIIANRINQDDFAKSDDIWSLMSNTSNALTTPMSTAADGAMTCVDAYNDLNGRWPTEITSTMQMHGRSINPTATNNVLAGTMLATQLSDAYSQLTNISKSATEMLRQNMAINSVRDSQMVAAQKLNSDSNAIINAAQTQVEATTNINYITMARVAERAAPGIRNVVEIICYAVFPIVILLLVIAGEHAGKVLKGYVMSLVWIQLIPPLYAVLNFVMTSVSQTKLVGIASSTGSSAAVNMANIAQISQHGLSDMAIAGYLTLSLPVIAWALVKAGEIGGASLFSAVLSTASSSSSHSAGNLATGNVSQGNVSLDSTSANNVNASHYDTAPSMNSGYTRISSAMGTATIGRDGTYRFSGNQSSLGFGANFGQKIGNALSTEAAARQEVAARESDAASQMKTAALVERMGLMRAYADQQGTSNLDEAAHGSRTGRSVAQMQQIAENVNRRLGLAANSTVGQRIVGTLSMGGHVGGDLKVFGAQVGLSNDRISDAGKQKSLESALAFARDELKSHNITADQALSADFRSSSAYQWGKQNRIESVKGEEAALTSAQQHTHNAEVAKSEAFALSTQARTVTENWLHYSMNYEGYIANRLHQDGKLEAFNMLYQTNPEQAARMAAGYLAETNFDVMPSMRPVSASIGDVQSNSPELSGRTVAGEAAMYGAPADTTKSAYRQGQARVRHDGYTEPHAIANQIGSRVTAAETSTRQAIANDGGSIASELNSSSAEANKSLDRKTAGKGWNEDPAPATGTAADFQDKTHESLFSLPADKKRPAK